MVGHKLEQTLGSLGYGSKPQEMKMLLPVCRLVPVYLK
jgi:hypothetical protein